MPTLPTGISSSPPNYTPAEHAAHHNTAHGILNGLQRHVITITIIDDLA